MSLTHLEVPEEDIADLVVAPANVGCYRKREPPDNYDTALGFHSIVLIIFSCLSFLIFLTILTPVAAERVTYVSVTSHMTIPARNFGKDTDESEKKTTTDASEGSVKAHATTTAFLKELLDQGLEWEPRTFMDHAATTTFLNKLLNRGLVPRTFTPARETSIRLRHRTSMAAERPRPGINN